MQQILIKNHTGSILAGGSDVAPDTTGKGGKGNTGVDWANEYNRIQGYAVAHSRLHIPVVFGVDAVHGFGHPYNAPLFPQSIGVGATWNPAVARAGGRVTGNATAVTGWNWVFAPVQDVARDNRWGRYYETWAEEPTLAAAMGAADVAGMQSVLTPGGLRTAATVKHFAGYSESINGHDRVQAELPMRYLQDVFLPSYAGGIDAHAGAVMVDSGTGKVAGTDVVPVYVHQPVSDVVVPQQRLVGFARVAVDPGQTKRVTVAFPVSRLAVTPGDIDSAQRPNVAPGDYVVQLDADSTTPYQVVLSAPFTLQY